MNTEILRNSKLKRCEWAGVDPLMQGYHDKFWGREVRDPKELFRMLILEGAQAGLSWLTVLKRFDDYDKAFYNFDAKKMATMGEDDILSLLDLRKNFQPPASARPVKTSFSSLYEATASPPSDKATFSSSESKSGESQFLRKSSLIQNSGIIRHRKKIESAIQNAKAYLKLKESGIDFAEFLWSFVGGEPKLNHPKNLSQIPTQTPESEAMSKALKSAGFNFVGPTICYAFMQAVGMVNDHAEECFLAQKS
jgi:DNA-3-methyladenine glycosylase I